MRRPGVVIETDGIHARVKMEKGVSCGDKGCPLSSSWIDDSQSNFYVVDAQNTIRASVGDQVLVELPDSAALSVAFLIYLFPLFVPLTAYFVLRLFVHSPVLFFLGILGGIVFSVVLIRRLDRSFIPDYRIVEFLGSGDCHLCPFLEKESPGSSGKMEFR